MKHEVILRTSERDRTGHIHPTPIAMQQHIFDSIEADIRAADPLLEPIPYRVFRLIREGMAKASAEHEAR
ncbi:hypothetical protein [Falsirhodobacter halotolerans]|uniref:hypothetical protein n=1 Tax=Falsirhodobacter halotolerans TaxID=1146892 RepID=UPI001FD22D15|nr:hypothetical protein [Falsirhodobacter halotolerans]MCJ8138572.1 hypothetical protein [Falsirhodobacter halotolerans]